MNNIPELLDHLERRIQKGYYLGTFEHIKLWGGADVIISSDLTPRIEKWVDDQPTVLSLQTLKPARRAVITRYASALSWLFYELKYIFSSSIDFISKYDFYGMLALSAKEYIANNENHDEKGLMIEVLENGARKYWESIKNDKIFLPKNLNLPFFSYGLFKPNQLCYYRLKELITEKNEVRVSGKLMERDGIPLLVSSGYIEIEGYVYKFGDSMEAYKRIADIEPRKVYKWDEIETLDGELVNALIGRSENKGSTELEHITSWNSKDDPYFTDALELVEESLQEYKTNTTTNLFRMQMAYMLLWSSIERYASLKYHLGDSVTQKVYQLAQEETFITSLKREVTEIRNVLRVSDLTKYTLDQENPDKSIRYYYQVRSNVVHRGKAVTKDFSIVYNSCKELYSIFNYMIAEFKQSNAK